ncbi:sodium channel protein Nach-like [Anastrepha obliqua]|uniref:sodium channel protein Nach-like n=1 Tax=Anastrepha obliqua TaxID=95512 RepID=UPI00240A215E|nr:sodium channel protein Nach-like [Anastrepha obliqua]
MKTTSGAIWWINSPKRVSKWAEKKRKQSVGAIFSHDMADLFRNISMHGYSKLVDNTLNLWQKIIWLTVHMTTMCALFTVLSLIWEQFVAQYIVINLHNPLYPIESVPFPSISICSNSRISYQAALAHAKRLSAKDPNGRTVDYFMEHLKFFISLYLKSDQDVDLDIYSNFQAFLDIYDTYENETFYNTRRIMQMLAPSCSNLIRSCMLAGNEIDCFSAKAFQPSLTSYGPCCTFNTGDFYQNRNHRNRFASSELGFTVILNTTHQDYFTPIFPVDGYIVIVHHPAVFPDAISGEAHELFLTNSAEAFISLRSLLVFTEPSLRSYSPQTRKCYFNDDFPKYINTGHFHYSLANCITRCRMLSMLALCRCIPFYMPLELVSDVSDLVVCTIYHAHCLLSYRFKWNNVLTQREPIPGLARASQEALFCPDCLPACDDIQNEVSLMALPIDRFIASSTAGEMQKIGLQAQNMSVLRVYFAQTHAKYYKRMIGNSWYEAVCTIGNVTSIFLGFSVVAIFEIAYFFVKYMALAIKAGIKQNQRKAKKDTKQGNKEDMQLYICP